MQDLDKELALFKFSIIAPAVNHTFKEKTLSAFFNNASKKIYAFNGDKKKFSATTLERWYKKYISSGIDGLFVKQRDDFGRSRHLTIPVKNRINELFNEFPHITTTAVYKKLIEEGEITANDVSISTIYRFVKSNDLKQKIVTSQLAFEMEHPNDLWQADTSVGPYININKTKTKTYIILFIDDSTRTIVSFGVFLQDNALNMQHVFKDAIAKYGVPKRLYVDNGAPYKNIQLQLICASLGVTLINSTPLRPIGKGKIERAFRTIKDGWMNQINWNEFNSCEDVQSSLLEFINKYNNKIHSSTKKEPIHHFNKYIDNIKYIEYDDLYEHFMHREQRTVRKDSTITIRNTLFEVPSKFIGLRINIRFVPDDITKAFIYHDDEVIPIAIVNKKDNSRIKRKTINFGDAV